MVFDRELIGEFTKLRSVETIDAKFILTLRLDERLNQFLNPVDNDLQKQIQWIKSQRTRENDYYFLICDLNGEPLGTISLYDITINDAYFGRWISIGHPIQNLESVLLLHDFGFYTLHLARIYSRVVINNHKVLKFHERFGAKRKCIINKPENKFVLQENEIFERDYDKLRQKNMAVINKFLK